MKFHLPIPRHDHTQFIQMDTALCRACWKCAGACHKLYSAKPLFAVTNTCM